LKLDSLLQEMDPTAGSSSNQHKRKHADQQADVKSSKQKNKRSKKSFPVVPLRVPVPNEEDCRLSDNIADSVRTLCRVCDQSFTLNYMRFHTKEKHMLQITKYKELYGPFQIIESVFHKCKLCGKIVLLDSDTLGGHIKGVHKMKEKMYKERFMTYSLHLKPTIQSASSSEADEGKTALKKNSLHRKEDDFPDYEYSCKKHYDPCGQNRACTGLEGVDGVEATNDEIKGLYTDNEEEHVLEEDMGTRQSYNVGGGGWSKKFLPTDFLIGGERNDEDDGDDIDENNVTIDFSDESLVEDTDTDDSFH